MPLHGGVNEHLNSGFRLGAIPQLRCVSADFLNASANECLMSSPVVLAHCPLRHLSRPLRHRPSGSAPARLG